MHAAKLSGISGKTTMLVPQKKIKLAMKQTIYGFDAEASSSALALSTAAAASIAEIT